MYQEFYGLRERPFDLGSSLKYLLLLQNYQEALSNLEYGISTGNGIILLLGEPGTGKTTILRKVVASHTERPRARAVRWAYLANPRLSQAEFFEILTQQLQLDPGAAASKARFLRELELNLIHCHEQGIVTVLVNDEAQSLPDVLLEEVRLLSNIETGTEKLLRVVLAGQPALGERLNEPGLRQLKQRVGFRCVLPPLNLRETAVYIAHRLSLAGGNPASIFSRDAVVAIYQRSGGIPRMINVICENVLLTGFAADRRPAGAETVLEVCRDLDVDGGARILSTTGRLPGDSGGATRAGSPSMEVDRTAETRRRLFANAGARILSLSYLASRRP
jgi:general secretion pathway protein A